MPTNSATDIGIVGNMILFILSGNIRKNCGVKMFTVLANWLSPLEGIQERKKILRRNVLRRYYDKNRVEILKRQTERRSLNRVSKNSGC